MSLQFVGDSVPLVADLCVHEILTYIDEPIQLLLLRRVSKQFYHRVSSDLVWKEVILRRRPFIHEGILGKGNLMKLYFQFIFPDSLKKFLQTEEQMMKNWKKSVVELSPYDPYEGQEHSLYVMHNSALDEGKILHRLYYCRICKKSFSLSSTREEDRKGLEMLCTAYKTGYFFSYHFYGYCSKACFNKDIAKFKNKSDEDEDNFDDQEIQKKLGSFFNMKWDGIKKDIRKSGIGQGIGECARNAPFVNMNYSAFYREMREEVYGLLEPENSVFRIGKILVESYNRMSESSYEEFIYFLYK